MQQTLDFEIPDVCAVRHRNSETSIKANAKASKSKTAWRFMCLEFIKNRGTATLKEICDHYDKTPNQLSGRISALRFDGKIEKVGNETRGGCAVYRLKNVG